MKRTFLGLVIAPFFFSTLPLGLSEQVDRSPRAGTITGQVVDADGNPAANASVVLLRDPPTMAFAPSTSTDDAGKFALKDVEIPGTYMIEALKVDEDYLMTCLILLHCPPVGTCPKVTLTPSNPRAEVTVRLGPKGGRVAGVVRDARSGKRVANAVVTVYGKSKEGSSSLIEVQSDRQGAFISDPLPLGPIRMKVEAPRDRTWHFNGVAESNAANDLVLESGKIRKVNVFLVRE